MQIHRCFFPFGNCLGANEFIRSGEVGGDRKPGERVEGAFQVFHQMVVSEGRLHNYLGSFPLSGFALYVTYGAYSRFSINGDISQKSKRLPIES